MGRVHLEHLRQEKQYIELRGIEGHRLPGIDTEQGNQHDLEVFPFTERLADRRLAGFTFGFHFYESRRLVHAHADPGRDAQQHDGQQERQAPAPDFKLVAGQVAATQNHQQRQQQAQGGGGLNPAGVETAFAGSGVFRNISGRATIFTAQRQPLEHAQYHEHDRGRDADAGIGRQQADSKGR